VTDARMYPERPFLAASVCVVRGDKVLLAARARPPMEGVFTLPGGVVEPGETLAEAAIRELHEEVGVAAEIVGFVGPVEIIDRDEAGRTRRHFVVCAHAARWISGEGTVGEEALEVRWLRPDEIGSVRTTAGLPGIVAQAVALASQHRSS
jgi:8-oxo-dGTP diphosphatase